MSIWIACNGEAHVEALQFEAVRVVESQEEAATTLICRSMADQVLLEELLDANKPASLSGNQHYLITTPFRYPPLKHGSRFGRREHRGMFYASLGVETALAETAYYRFLFLAGMRDPFPLPVVTTHCVFAVGISSERGVRLQAGPFVDYANVLVSPTNYEPTQALGSDMRDAGVEVFQFVSARDPRHGLNVAVIEPSAIVSTMPLWMESWVCRTAPDRVGFSRVRSKAFPVEFCLSEFLVRGELPHPAV